MGTLKVEIKVTNLSDVLGAVWLATAILTFERCLNVNRISNHEDLAFTQNEIRLLASQFCSKTIHAARISQWCNGDHPNSQRNYLRAVGGLRRLTLPGEFDSKDEMPDKLMDTNQVVFFHPVNERSYTYFDLLSWIKNDFMALLQNSGISVLARDLNLHNRTNTVQLKKISVSLLSNKNEEIWLSEDEAKKHLENYLIRQGWTVKVAWGHARGIDIEANKGSERWIIEVKGSGSRQPMRVNYFIGMMGELLQRMDDPHAKYSIALPDMKQFRSLWSKLPLLAKQRTGISSIFIKEDGSIEEQV